MLPKRRAATIPIGNTRYGCLVWSKATPRLGRAVSRSSAVLRATISGGISSRVNSDRFDGSRLVRVDGTRAAPGQPSPGPRQPQRPTQRAGRSRKESTRARGHSGWNGRQSQSPARKEVSEAVRIAVRRATSREAVSTGPAIADALGTGVSGENSLLASGDDDALLRSFGIKVVAQDLAPPVRDMDYVA